MTFVLKETLMRHLTQVHKITDTADRDAKVAQSRYEEIHRGYPCGVKSCRDKFLWQANLLLHLENEHKIEKIEAAELVAKWDKPRDGDDAHGDRELNENDSGDIEGGGKENGEVASEESVGQNNEQSHIKGVSTTLTRPSDAFLKK
jgi:hypothetical protein